MSEQTVENKIELYWHCKQCLLERPEDVSPAEWARLSVGSTPKGFQVWCGRHERNVVAIDLLGQKVTYDHGQKE